MLGHKVGFALCVHRSTGGFKELLGIAMRVSSMSVAWMEQELPGSTVSKRRYSSQIRGMGLHS